MRHPLRNRRRQPIPAPRAVGARRVGKRRDRRRMGGESDHGPVLRDRDHDLDALDVVLAPVQQPKPQRRPAGEQPVGLARELLPAVGEVGLDLGTVLRRGTRVGIRRGERQGHVRPAQRRRVPGRPLRPLLERPRVRTRLGHHRVHRGERRRVEPPHSAGPAASPRFPGRPAPRAFVVRATYAGSPPQVEHRYLADDFEGDDRRRSRGRSRASTAAGSARCPRTSTAAPPECSGPPSTPPAPRRDGPTRDLRRRDGVLHTAGGGSRNR